MYGEHIRHFDSVQTRPQIVCQIAKKALMNFLYVE